MKCIVLPEPRVLSAQILPPINSTKRFEMARPRPVPPYLRVVETSACEKLSKMAPRRSAGIPMPVSETEKCRMLGAESISTSTLISPRSVNLAALPSRFKRICRRRPAIADQARGHAWLNAAAKAKPLGIAHERRQYRALPRELRRDRTRSSQARSARLRPSRSREYR